MAVQLLEINDLGVSLSGEHGRVESPGYALLDGASLTTGEQARARARMLPRQVVSQFWSRLGTDPLPNQNGRARHNADLAWAHLNDLHNRAGKPEELVIAVPASMSREQLGILLGIAERSDFATVGLVDSAVAAAAGSGRRATALHLDLQLHHCVLTQIGFDGQSLVRERAEVVAASGWLQLMERWAAMATAAFVRQCRFDPLHAAQTEQQLYDSIPAWLEALRGAPECAVELHSAANSYRATLRREDVVAAASPVLKQLDAALKRFTGHSTLLLSHRALDIPGIESLGHPVEPVDHEATLRGCVANIDLLRSNDGSVRFVHRLLPVGVSVEAPAAQPAELPAVDVPADVGTTPSPAAMPTPSLSVNVERPTHLLWGSRALRLSVQGIAIGVSANGWQLGADCTAPCGLIRYAQDQWWLDADAEAGLTLNGRRIQRPAELISGDRIGLSGSELTDLRLITELH